MNILNRYFEKVFIITTSHSDQRHEYIKKIVKKENIRCEFVFAPNKKYCVEFYNKDLWGEIRHDNSAYTSLTSSYYSIFTSSIFHGYKNILIFEDDVKFEENYEIKFQNFMKNLPSNWNFLNLGFHDSKHDKHGWKTFDINEYVSVIDVFWTTHATAFQGIDFYYKLINRMNEYNNSIEHILNYFTHLEKENKSYTPKEIMFTQCSYRDNDLLIRGKNSFKSLIV